MPTYPTLLAPEHHNAERFSIGGDDLPVLVGTGGSRGVPRGRHPGHVCLAQVMEFRHGNDCRWRHCLELGPQRVLHLESASCSDAWPNSGLSGYPGAMSVHPTAQRGSASFADEGPVTTLRKIGPGSSRWPRGGA